MTITHPMDPVLTTTETSQNFALRAAAHAANPDVLRVAQRWNDRVVTDEAVARVFLALEYYGIRPYRNTGGRWFAPTGTALYGYGRKLSTIVNEMIRTGLVRHWKDREGDHLIPAPVHYLKRTVQGPGLMEVHSACLFIGEDRGPMRSRLVERMDLTDCLACESAIARGTVPKL